MELPNFDVEVMGEGVAISIEGNFSDEEKTEIQTHINNELDLDFSEQKLRGRK